MLHKLLSISLLLFVFNSCKEKTTKNIEEPTQEENIISLEVDKYPRSLGKVFDAHGGLKAWKEYKTLEYSLSKKGYSEKHTTSLRSRKDKIEAPNYSIGFDGKDVWKLDSQDSYKGDPIFYHNLFFYFYAMPFVLADNGIVYSETPNLEFEGVSYPGVRISYNPGVGTSYKDNYFVHYHPETHVMQWLGYTVTYRSGEVSDNIKWIRYNDWQTVDNVILPKSITWYNYKGREIKEVKKTVIFDAVKLSREERLEGFYKKPNGAVLAKKK